MYYKKEEGECMKKEGNKRLNVIINPELHKKIKVAAAENEITLGEYVSQALLEKLESEKEGE